MLRLQWFFINFTAILSPAVLVVCSSEILIRLIRLTVVMNLIAASSVNPFDHRKIKLYCCLKPSVVHDGKSFWFWKIVQIDIIWIV